MIVSKIQSILLVDDDHDDQYVFNDCITSLGIHTSVLTAYDGLDALERLASLTDLPQVIFLDLNMPRMNGKQLLQELKASERFRDIPVIVYTTSSSADDIAAAKSLGAARFITKPNSYDELCNTLSELLKETELSLLGNDSPTNGH